MWSRISSKFWTKFQSTGQKQSGSWFGRRAQSRASSTGPQDPNINVKVKSNEGVEPKSLRQKNLNIAYYMTAAGIACVGISYAAVPLYRLFCSVTGYGGTAQTGTEVPKSIGPREITVHFNSHVSDTLPWSFIPAQKTAEIVPGETVLAFYEATNKTDKPIIGIATYNVQPSRVGLYFTKLQCFCFDEQRLNPKETVMMPVLFYIHPDMLDDHTLDGVTEVTLSYTFFLANDQQAHLLAAQNVESAASQ